MGSVVVVGSINVDFVVVVERLPRPGETVAGGRFARHWGGKGANQAVAAARYGADVHLLGAVGEDDLGEGAVAALVADGVSTERVGRLPDSATGVALVTVDRNGDNQIAVASGANLQVDADDLAGLLAGLPGPGVILTVFEVPDAAVARTLDAGRAAGWQVVVNPAPARELLDAFHGSGAILTPNRGELEVIAGAGQPQVAARRLAEEVTGGPVVVSLGADGALVVTGDEVTTVRPPSVVARDTTGAGDTMNGVLAGGLAEGRPLLEAVQRSVAAAAFSVEVEGARDGMPTGDELRQRLDG
ncbi:MAG TPA: ribokinase [Nitriliruptorales bacterium]|nr:ribokinase [Nitriliruptorales bacterium]